MENAMPRDNRPRKFVFRKHANIGAADAREDRNFLAECFIETEDLSVLRDVDRPECIVMGRTGCGKTALLQELGRREDRVTALEPDNLALTYVSNNQTRECQKFCVNPLVDIRTPPGLQSG
jgi:hypothetical protein